MPLAMGLLCMGPSVGLAVARGELEADGGEEPLAAKPRLHQSLRGWSGGSDGGPRGCRLCLCKGPPPAGTVPNCPTWHGLLAPGPPLGK